MPFCIERFNGFCFHEQKQVNAIQTEFYSFAQTIKDIFVKLAIEATLQDNWLTIYYRAKVDRILMVGSFSANN